MISNLFYYALYTSVVFIYGVGINQSLVLSENYSKIFIKAIKMLLAVCSTVALTYLFTSYLLAPARLTEMLPFVAVVIFIIISVFVEFLIRITAKTDASDYGLSMLFVLLALFESTTLAESIINSCICILTFYVFIPLLTCINNIINVSKHKQRVENIVLMFISLSIIMIALFSWNVSWLNRGGF